MRAVIYARKSITDKGRDKDMQSGSVDQQLAAGRHYAAAQGWEVVNVFVDDGVSAERAPDEREGWQALLAAQGYDRIIVRHLDRVSRRLLDFLTTDKALRARGVGLVSISQQGGSGPRSARQVRVRPSPCEQVGRRYAVVVHSDALPQSTPPVAPTSTSARSATSWLPDARPTHRAEAARLTMLSV